MDRYRCKFFRVVEQMKTRLGASPVPIVIPIGSEENFTGVVDLIEMKSIIWDEASQGMKFEYGEIPADLVDTAEEWRTNMIEAAAEASEELMDKYLEEGELSKEDIVAGLRIRTLASEIQPMLCGSAFKNKGVQRMLDAVIEFFNQHLMMLEAIKGILDDKAETEASREASDEAPFQHWHSKIMNDKYVGNLTFVRVYSGVVKQGDSVYNPVKMKRERIGRIVQMHANEQKEVEEIRAGDIAALVGMKDVTTGDTLCDNDNIITLERMEFPEPVISLAVEPKTKLTKKKCQLLWVVAKEDPSFRVRTDEESGQTIISGMGELHLDIIVDRMKREFNVEANIGAPQVAYRETIRQSVEVEGKVRSSNRWSW